MKSKKGFRSYKKKDHKDVRDNKDREKQNVRKLYLSKSGETNFHLWKEEMQLKIAIDYPLFANIFENARHATFATPSLEIFVNRDKAARVYSDSDNSDTDNDNDRQRHQNDQSDNEMSDRDEV